MFLLHLRGGGLFFISLFHSWICHFFYDWFFGVSIFGFNYLRQFSINFRNSCAYIVENFLNFMKYSQIFHFAWIWRKLWALNEENKREINMPIWACNISSYFQVIFHGYGSRVPKWNYAHIYLCKQPKNTIKTLKNGMFIANLLSQIAGKHPVVQQNNFSS